MFDFRSVFDEAMYYFANLAIQLFHNSAGTVIINTVLAVDPSILLPVTDSPLPTCRQQDTHYVCEILHRRFRQVDFNPRPDRASCRILYRTPTDNAHHGQWSWR